ncbi:MAG: hypothetical protein EXX96DRAFT_595146 [Benjaminiella poitrasii]|nr:MAG: hypothetical protein EXX96DRAFT_595146 [Benjaminiella poitrasii]
MNTGRQQQQQQQYNPNTMTGNPRDFDQIRRSYHSALSELTFNSKPIITNLTIMAQENQFAANVIVREIENQLRNNAPGQKLPVLYLIDSICKNVGGVYISHFARNIVNVFLDAYTLVDPTIRKSFERLLQTWKNGLPGGQPVFSRHVIESIERSVMYIHEKTPTSKYPHLPTTNSANNKMSPSPQHMNNPSIHVNPNFIHKEQRIINPNNPRDPRNRSPQVSEKTIPPLPMSPSSNLLSQLQSMLPAQNTSPIPSLINNIQSPAISNINPLPQIIGQIKAILPTLPPAQASSIEQYLSQITAVSPTVQNATAAPMANPGLSPNLASDPRLNYPTAATSTPPSLINTTLSPVLPTTTSTLSSAIAAATAPNLSTPSPVPANIDTADLLKSLTSMGYLSPTPASVTTTTATSAATPNTSTPEPTTVTTTTTTTTTEGHMTLEQFGSFLLDSKDLQVARPGAIELLYSAEPLQCKQCGFRYPKTEKGQARMDAHLDSHFRQNRKMKERVKRGLSRSWFVTVDEWVHGEGGELTSQQAPAFLHDNSSANQKSTDKTSQANEETIDPNKYTVIMPDGDDRKPCPICGERFIDFWNDEEEEWMYRNAIMMDGKIYHATCHADAVKSGSLVNSDTNMDQDHSLKRKIDDENEETNKQARVV